MFLFFFFIRLGKAVQKLAFGGSSYTFHTKSVQQRNWEDSRRSCKETGSDLVSIEILEEWVFLKNTILCMRTGEYFIGLRKNGKSGKWRWISDNREVTTPKGTFYWAKGEPNGDGDCAVMYKDYRKDYGEYNDLSCTEKNVNAGYICESHNESNGTDGMFCKLYTFCRLLYLQLFFPLVKKYSRPGDLVVLCCKGKINSF